MLARKGPESVAIEVESGQSNVIQNLKENLRCGFGRIFIVATDEKALEKVEQLVGNAGLFLPQVAIVLRDRLQKHVE